MLTVYHCDSNRTSHHPPRIIRGGFFHPFLLPPSHGQPTTASTSHDDSLVCRSVASTASLLQLLTTHCRVVTTPCPAMTMTNDEHLLLIICSFLSLRPAINGPKQRQTVDTSSEPIVRVFL